MNSDSLTNVLAEEKRFANEWQKLPHHYIEIAKLMFTVAEEDFSEFDMDVHEVSSDSHSSERSGFVDFRSNFPTDSRLSLPPTSTLCASFVGCSVFCPPHGVRRFAG